jgi:hypothetical protein
MVSDKTVFTTKDAKTTKFFVGAGFETRPPIESFVSFVISVVNKIGGNPTHRTDYGSTNQPITHEK